MDSCGEYLTLVFEPSGEVRNIPVTVLERYPNSPLYVGWKDTNCSQLTIDDIDVNQFDQMMLVINNVASPSTYSRETKLLLDHYDFIEPIAVKVKSIAAQLCQTLETSVTPFVQQQVDFYWCTSESEYLQCKEMFEDLLVVPLQVLTIGNHLYFASYSGGVPFLKTSGNNLKLRCPSRYDWLPSDQEMDSVHNVIKRSITYCETHLREGICHAGQPVREQPIATRLTDGLYCGYCGKQDCKCIEQIYLEYGHEIGSHSTVRYMNGLFGLTSMAIMQQLQYVLPYENEYPSKRGINELDGLEIQRIKTLLCKYQWVNVASAKSQVLYPLTGATKLSMHLGFVRLHAVHNVPLIARLL